MRKGGELAIGEMRGVEDGNQRKCRWRREGQKCRGGKQWGSFTREWRDEERLSSRGGIDVVERKKRASNESVALRHSAAAALTDSHSLTTDCLLAD